MGRVLRSLEFLINPQISILPPKTLKLKQRPFFAIHKPVFNMHNYKSCKSSAQIHKFFITSDQNSIDTSCSGEGSSEHFSVHRLSQTNNGVGYSSTDVGSHYHGYGWSQLDD